ncbi:MAG TPA: sigma-70 family RNA polymerase sigma factor [Phycisphaerae bacterium]|nr:sigma-70 family RNA polymerase sigma factor [Phycisphaerae bacterium]
MTDRELLRAYQTAGDEAAFTRLVERHADAVYSAALRQCGDPATAEDVMQAVFILLVHKGPALPSHESLTGWLLKAAHYCVRDALKIARRRTLHERAAGQLRAPAQPRNDTAWDAISAHVDNALAELGSKERGAIALKYFENRTLEEIGESLGISKEGAHKRVKRGLVKLRQVLSRRGIALPAAGIAAALLGRPADAAPQTLKLLIAKQVVTAHWNAPLQSVRIAKGAWKMVMFAKLKAAGLTAIAAIAILAFAVWPLLNVRGTAAVPVQPPPAADTIMPGDTLCIGVTGLSPAEVETVKTVHVSAAGDVQLLYVGAVHVGGMEFSAAEKAIADDYRNAQFVMNTSVSVNRLTGNHEARPLRAGDRVSVRIFELARPGEWVLRVVPISDGGHVGLPFIGQVQLVGLEEGAAEKAIAARYQDQNLLRNAIVSVYRLEEDEAIEPTIEPGGIWARARK